MDGSSHLMEAQASPAKSCPFSSTRAAGSDSPVREYAGYCRAELEIRFGMPLFRREGAPARQAVPVPYPAARHNFFCGQSCRIRGPGGHETVRFLFRNINSPQQRIPWSYMYYWDYSFRNARKINGYFCLNTIYSGNYLQLIRPGIATFLMSQGTVWPRGKLKQ
jgi:hypothetical protein